MGIVMLVRQLLYIETVLMFHYKDAVLPSYLCKKNPISGKRYLYWNSLNRQIAYCFSRFKDRNQYPTLWSPTPNNGVLGVVMLKILEYFKWTYFTLLYDDSVLNSAPPGQNGRHFKDDIFRCIFVNEKFYNLIKFSLKFVPKGSIDDNPALVQVMAWRRMGDKPLSELMLNRFTDAYMQH